MSCKDAPESPYSPLQSLNDPPGYARVEMMSSPTFHVKVSIGDGTERPFFGYVGYKDDRYSGTYKGILKNTGTKAVKAVRLTINYFSESEFLAQVVVPSTPVSCEFYFCEWGGIEHIPSVCEYFSDVILKPNEEVAWRAMLLHEGNDWRTEIEKWRTQFIIEWDETS